MKNTGGVTIHDLDDLDVFVHGRGDSERISHTSDAGAAYPRWTYAIEGAGTWLTGKTLTITVHYASALSDDDYVFEIVTPESVRALRAFAF